MTSRLQDRRLADAMTASEAWTLSIAVYAAGVSTLVLLWDAYKWRNTGPKVWMRAYAGMKIVGDRIDPATYVKVEAVNRGDRATTLTGLDLMCFESRFDQFFRPRKGKFFVVTTPLDLPRKFESGQRWVGIFPQDDELTSMMRKGVLLVVLSHASGGRGVRQRVRAPAVQ